MFRGFLSASDDPSALRVLDVRPDDTDSRDYIFSPSLDLLPQSIDPRPEGPLFVFDQGQEGSCVGHALAAVINISLLRRKAQLPSGVRKKHRKTVRDEDIASERMLYEMGRRYDEWKGENYEGTSLRGAMKGWHKHGVCSRALWPYEQGKPGHLTPERAQDALIRPLGAYYRIIDSDVSHVQGAIYEGDAVLASAWVHSGWRADLLEEPEPEDSLRIRRIPFRGDNGGLHAIALVGYGPEGFIVQNSWGTNWGTGGLAILSYDDWFQNRQDAWVARPGPTTLDKDRAPKIFLVAFAGAAADPSKPAGIWGTEGLDIDREALPYLINTGDRGGLSADGRLETREEDLPKMASLVRLAPAKNGARNVVLYAHGGLVSEASALETAVRLWRFCRPLGLTAYFFVWETGMKETLLGMLRSQDDALGPRAGLDLGYFLHAMEKGAREAVKLAQRGLGRALAPIASSGWKEMHGRALGASVPKTGGAALFAEALCKEMTNAGGNEPFRLHLVGHSAGSIFLARLYQGFLAGQIEGSGGRIQLGSVQFMAPALSVGLAQQIFVKSGSLPVPFSQFRVFHLSDQAEDSDSIGIYPSSLLTYVADHLEGNKRTPLLGIGKDMRQQWKGPVKPTVVQATQSKRHSDFDNPGFEVETILKDLA